MNNKILSAGKRRGLQVTSNNSSHFTILAIDHGIDMKVTIRPDDPESVSYAQIVGVKTGLIDILGPSVSAVLVDPVYGLAPAVMFDRLPGNIGLLMQIEDADYASPVRPSRQIAGWSVAQIKKAGGAAVKVYIHYMPDGSELAQTQESFIESLVAACAENSLPLFAEPISYGVSGDAKRRAVIESGRRFSDLGVDVLKSEFPVDIKVEKDLAVWEEACHELSEAIDVPWVLLSAGVDFPQFSQQVAAACKGGASGYLAGRAIWKEAMKLNTAGQEDFLRETAVSRLNTLNEIVEKFARPWNEIYQPVEVQEDWYKGV